MAAKPAPFRYRTRTSSHLRLNPKRRTAKLRKRLGLPPASYLPRSIEVLDATEDDISTPSSSLYTRTVNTDQNSEPNLVVHRDGCTCPRGRVWGVGQIPPCLKGIEREEVVRIVTKQLGTTGWATEADEDVDMGRGEDGGGGLSETSSSGRRNQAVEVEVRDGFALQK